MIISLASSLAGVRQYAGVDKAVIRRGSGIPVTFDVADRNTAFAYDRIVQREQRGNFDG